MALLYCGGSASDAFGALIASGILGGLSQIAHYALKSQIVLMLRLKVALLCGGHIDYLS
jgi:hypothetical protein